MDVVATSYISPETSRASGNVTTGPPPAGSEFLAPHTALSCFWIYHPPAAYIDAETSRRSGNSIKMSSRLRPNRPHGNRGQMVDRPVFPVSMTNRGYLYFFNNPIAKKDECDLRWGNPASISVGEVHDFALKYQQSWQMHASSHDPSWAIISDKDASILGHFWTLVTWRRNTPTRATPIHEYGFGSGPLEDSMGIPRLIQFLVEITHSRGDSETSSFGPQSRLRMPLFLPFSGREGRGDKHDIEDKLLAGNMSSDGDVWREYEINALIPPRSGRNEFADLLRPIRRRSTFPLTGSDLPASLEIPRYRSHRSVHNWSSLHTP